MKHYHERMDDLFAKGNPWKHRTLRTIFDPFSSEWNMSAMDEKVEIVKTIIQSGEHLGFIATEYERYYKNDLKREDISKDLKSGLIQILEYLLTEKV